MSKSIPAIEQKERAKHGEQMFPLKNTSQSWIRIFPSSCPTGMRKRNSP